MYAPGVGASMRGFVCRRAIHDAFAADVALVNFRSVIIYEKLLDADPAAALEEGSLHFDERGPGSPGVEEDYETARMNLEFPMRWPMAWPISCTGCRRFTEDIDSFSVTARRDWQRLPQSA